MTQYLHPSLRHGLVGAWCPSQGASGGILLDRSGYNNHGTLTNMDPGTDWVASGDGLALDFDGTNDYVDIPVRNMPNIESAKTISLWLTYDGTTTRRILFALALTNNSVNLEINTAFGLPAVMVSVWGTTGLTTAFLDSGNANIPGNTWFHICYTTPGYATLNTLYINGRPWNYLPGTSSQSGTPTSCRIGSFNPAFPSPYHNRQIDDVLVYNRVLSQHEIAVLAQRRGIIYETMPTRYHMRGPTGGGGTFKPYWARRQSQVIGGR